MDYYEHPERPGHGMIELDPDDEGEVMLRLVLTCGDIINVDQSEVTTILISADGVEPELPY